MKSMSKQRTCPKETGRSSPLVLSLFLLVLILKAPQTLAWSLTSREAPSEASVQNAFQNFAAPFVQKYESLPPQGKFAAGAVVGFASSRCVVGATVTVVKGAGLAFVVSELVQFSGALNRQELSDEGVKLARDLKDNFVSAVDGCKYRLKRYVDPRELRSRISERIEKDKVGFGGFASGAAAGFLL